MSTWEIFVYSLCVGSIFIFIISIFRSNRPGSIYVYCFLCAISVNYLYDHYHSYQHLINKVKKISCTQQS
jgi:hypothetical protein